MSDVSMPKGRFSKAENDHGSPPWKLSPDERLVIAIAAQRYLLDARGPRPLPWREVAEQLRDMSGDAQWTAKRVERVAAAVRNRLASAGITGLLRDEVGEPVGQTLKRNLIYGLLDRGGLTLDDLEPIAPAALVQVLRELGIPVARSGGVSRDDVARRAATAASSEIVADHGTDQLRCLPEGPHRRRLTVGSVPTSWGRGDFATQTTVEDPARSSERAKERDMSGKWLVVAGIDLGTHASGFAWTTVEDRNEDPAHRRIHTYTQWPGQPVASAKTLTYLLLGPDDEVVAWGHEAHQLAVSRSTNGQDAGLRPKHGFKMALGRDPDEVLSARPSLALHDRESAPERLMMLYLRKMYELAVSEIAKSGYRENEIRWCITVPAIWDDYQKYLVRQAAVEAGFPNAEGQLLLALEPEAAAQYARISGVRTGHRGEEIDVDLTAPGTRFVVADCGGGTVDLTAYEVLNPGGMNEVGKVSGDKRGSKYLNVAFEELVLKERLGGQRAYERLQQTCPEAIEYVLDRWEANKLHIKVGHERPLYVQLPAALVARMSPAVKRRLKARQGGDCTQIIVEPAEIEAIFGRVIPDIVEYVEQQLDFVGQTRGPSDAGEIVLLVGGFAASPYLRQSLADHFEGRAQVLVPPDPAIAVLAGAVHFAYRPDTRARRVRYTYGIGTCMPFEEGADPESKRIETRQGTRCDKRFEVFATVGDIVDVSREWISGYVPIYANQTGVRLQVYRTIDPAPRYVDQPGCDRLCTLSVDLEDVMHLALERRNVMVGMKFGETELNVRAYVAETGEEVHSSLNFQRLQALAI